jgi:hypothetical protein
MKSPKTIRKGALAAIAVALLTAAPASAALPDAAVSCRAAIAKSYPKLVNTAVKTISACHKARDKGDTDLTATDCNDISAADIKAKFSGAVTKHQATVAASCAGVAVAEALIQPDGPADFYTSCPVACVGVPEPMTTMAHVATCQGCEAGALAGGAMEATLGLPAQGSQTAANQKCRGAIGKGYGKYLSTFVKGATKCQGGQDAIGNNELAYCELPANNDPKGKAAGSLTKAGEGLDKSCVGVDLAVMAGCATDTLANLKACTATAWDTASDNTFSTTYEMPATGCPDVIRTQIRGGCTTNPRTGETSGDCSRGTQTDTGLSVGTTGNAHDVDITDAYMLAGEVICPGTERGTCGNCVVDGISDDSPQYQAFQRCVIDPWTPCTHAADGDPLRENDPVCQGGLGGACRYYLGPPLAISASGTPTCTLNVMNTEVTGTANPDNGESTLTLDLRSVVHTGLSQSRPCPICRNDATPQDGLAGGTCLGGPRNNQPCDVQGFDLTFAPTNADNPTTGNSLDCPPSSGANISGAGLAITLPLTTGTSTKSAQDACEAPLGALSCFCGVCSLDNTKSCETDLECSNLGLGTCTQGNGVDRKPNDCSDGYCIEVMGQTDRGECSGGPPHCIGGPNVDDLCAVDSECSVCIGGANDGLACADDTDCPGGTCDLYTCGQESDTVNFCSGVLFANGRGILPCTDDASCDSYISNSSNTDSWVCPGNVCGTCSVSTFRSCFLDPIEVSGTPDTENPVLAGSFCLPPSGNGSVNAATGSPGPGSVKTDAIVELRYY